MKQRGWIYGFFALSVVAAAAALAFRWIGPRGPDPWEGKPHPRVVVSLPPLACFVRNVVGPDAALACLCSAEGPDAYEPTEADAALLRGANLFLASGLDVDDRLADALHEKAPKVRFRKLSEDLPAGLGGMEGDPRVWLGVSRAVVLVQRTRDELKAVDPGRASVYDQNADRYVAELRKMEEEGKAAVAKKKDRRFVSVEGPLRHFADNFGLDLVAAVRLAANEKPGSKAYNEVISHIVPAAGVRVLAAGPKFERSATARELGKALQQRKLQGALVVVDPLEKAPPEELTDPQWYARKMVGNLARLLKYLP